MSVNEVSTLFEGVSSAAAGNHRARGWLIPIAQIRAGHPNNLLLQMSASVGEVTGAPPLFWVEKWRKCIQAAHDS